MYTNLAHRCVRSGLIILSFCFGFAGSDRALAQEQKDLLGEWTKQAQHELANPPERSGISLSAVEAVPNLLPAVTFNRYLSLLITDVDTVNQISFSDLMEHLAAQANDDGFSKEMLFHQWWDTQNQRPGLGRGPHCDDVPPQDSLNHFKYDCPRYEGGGTPANPPTNTPAQPAQATDSGVFATPPSGSVAPLDGYSPIAISNRFDLFSPAQPTAHGKVIYPDCGEYRIIFARNSGRTIAASQSPDGKEHDGDLRNRVLISFEFRVKNPESAPESASNTIPNGCLSILRFWHGLSQATSGVNRGQLLRAFFMTGAMKAPDGTVIGQLPGKLGAADLHNIALDSGQIRTNQFLNLVEDKAGTPPTTYNDGTPDVVNHSPNNWILREFRALIVGDKSLAVRLVPATTKSSPDVYLFNATPGGAEPRLKTLIANIEDQYPNLLGGNNFNSLDDINAISYRLTGSETNSYQSVTGSPQPCKLPSTCNPSPVDDIVAAASAQNPQYLLSGIQDFLDLPSTKKPATKITPINVVDRLRTQTCAGCHQFSDTKFGSFGYDPRGQLGGGAVWPLKACGDYAPSCGLPAFIIQDQTKLHPPMQFTQVSETVLIPSAADTDGKHWRYAISSTVECMLDFREGLMGKLFQFSPTKHCPSVPQ